MCTELQDTFLSESARHSIEWNTNNAFICIKEKKREYVYTHIYTTYMYVCDVQNLLLTCLYVYFLHFNMNSSIVCIMYTYNISSTLGE